ncbi:MAG: endo-1,4-beta-xylanase [Abitibacteriaceae bacterium]|nr:endo-1,4-beta-xylanase [Abditibacteriaceae bacterium]
MSDLFGLNAIGFFHYRNAPDAAAMAQKKMDVFKQTGATWDRFDFWWGEMEPKKGEWKWDKADWLIDFYMRNHVNMLPILSYSASWMKQSPHTPEDYADFADYVARVVARYKDRVHYWEVWNEPNIPTFWKPKPDPVAYTELLKAAYNAAHKADPDCVIVGAAANETDINWLLDIAKNGGMKYMDAISIHPYSMADGPEEMDLSRQLQNVKTFLRSQGRPDLPIWITEMGWTSTINDQAAMDKAARYMVQSYVIAAAEGVQHLFWFNLQDWTENGKLEGWGLTSPELQPKTALRVYRNLVDSLKGARFSGYLPIQSGEGYVFSDLVIAWAHRHRTAILPLGAFVLIRAYSPSAVEQDKDNGLLSWEKKPTFTLAETPFGIDGVSHDLLAKVMLQRPSPETNELIINPAFEELDKNGNPYAWHKGVFYGGADKGKFGVETNVNKEHSLSLSQTSEAMWESFPVPAMPGEKYTLTAQIKTNTATGDNGVQILFLAGSGWGWRGGPTTATVTGTTDWQTVKVTGTVPDDADVVRVNLVSKNNSGTVLFRAIHLTREEAK